MKETIFWQSREEPSSRVILAVASCGLLPRTTRPGPRVWTAYSTVAILPLRDTGRTRTWSPVHLARIQLSTASRKFRGRHRLNVILSLRRIRDSDALNRKRILRLRSQARFAQDDTALRDS